MKVRILPKSELSFERRGRYIRATYKPPFQWRGTVIDLETTDLPGEDWQRGNANKAEIITLGIGYQGKIYVYQRVDGTAQDFLQFAQSLARRRPMPYWAYSIQFERRILGFRDKWRDLMRYGEGENYYGDTYFYRMKCKDAAAEAGLSWDRPEDSWKMLDYYEIDGRSCPLLWQRWLQTHDEAFLTELIYHNLLDMLRECYLAFDTDARERRGRLLRSAQASARAGMPNTNTRDTNPEREYPQ